LSEVESSFNQFENTSGNRLEWKRSEGARARRLLRAFSFRECMPQQLLPLSTRELTSLVHFPTEGIESSPQFRQNRAKGAPAPLELPQEGALVGTNRYRGRDTNAYLTAEDRLRHVYIIGQTGTGKTTLMKNMIID